MAAEYAAGSATKPDTASSDTLVINTGLTSIAGMRFWWTWETENGISADYMYGEGLSDGTNHWSICTECPDATAAGSADRHKRHALKAITSIDPGAATVPFEATASFSGGTCTLTFSPNNSRQVLIGWEAWGGDIQASVQGNLELPLDAGTPEYTGFGISGSDGNSAVILLANGDPATAPVNEVGLGIATGFATSATQRASRRVSGAHDDNPSDNDFKYSTTSCLEMPAHKSVGGGGSADFDAWITDGFRLDWAGTGSTTPTFGAMVLDGAKFDVLNISSDTGSGAQTVSVAFSEQVIGTSFIAPITTGPGSGSHARCSTGASDGTNEATAAMSDEDGVDPSQADGGFHNARAIQLQTDFLVRSWNVTSMDAGSFDITPNTTGVSYVFAALVTGEAAVAGAKSLVFRHPTQRMQHMLVR